MPQEGQFVGFETQINGLVCNKERSVMKLGFLFSCLLSPKP